MSPAAIARARSTEPWKTRAADSCMPGKAGVSSVPTPWPTSARGSAEARRTASTSPAVCTVRSRSSRRDARVDHVDVVEQAEVAAQPGREVDPQGGQRVAVAEVVADEVLVPHHAGPVAHAPTLAAPGRAG